MKTKMAVLKVLTMIVGAWFWGISGVRAQTAPTITYEPVSQTNLVGSNANFSVTVSGPGPFTYQWQFNGANLVTTITSITGQGSSADNQPATNASLYAPSGVTPDAVGNLYIADTAHSRIRKVGINGIITTIAGGGVARYDGDGGPATNASLLGPQCVEFDQAGNFFIADTENNVVRKVDAQGIITTVAGNGIEGYSGEGRPATNASLDLPTCLAVDRSGNLYIADNHNHRVRKVDADGTITT